MFVPLHHVWKGAGSPPPYCSSLSWGGRAWERG